METNWVKCPICGNKTRVRVREDTILINFPLYCPKCRQEKMVNIKDSKILLTNEPDAKTQSR